MAAFIRASSRISSCYERYSRSISSFFPHRQRYTLFSLFHSAAVSPQRSPLECNILRILRSEMDHRSQFAPSHQPVSKFNAFTVEDRPGEQFITLRRKFAENENIKIEATMFDGAAVFGGDQSSGKGLQLHISLLVDVWKGEENELLEFLCSAWPDTLEIQKVFIFKRDDLANKIYMGPSIRDLKDTLRDEFYGFIRKRGVTDELAAFLHQYMMNKDKVEIVRWLGEVDSYIQR